MNSKDLHYDSLTIVDRIGELAIRKFGNYSAFGSALGQKKCWFYKVIEQGDGIQVDTLLKIAKVLDCDLEYIFTGKNFKPFVEDKYSPMTIINLNFPDTYNNLRVIKSNLKAGRQKTFTVRTLLCMEKALKIPAYKIIKKVIDNNKNV